MILVNLFTISHNIALNESSIKKDPDQLLLEQNCGCHFSLCNWKQGTAKQWVVQYGELVEVLMLSELGDSITQTIKGMLEMFEVNAC